MSVDLVAVAEKVGTEDTYIEARKRLKEDLQKIADRVRKRDPKRPAWKPLLDSRRVVRVVLILETLLPEFKFPPDKLVKKGGYNDVDEAAEDIIRRHKKLVEEKRKPKGRRK